VKLFIFFFSVINIICISNFVFFIICVCHVIYSALCRLKQGITFGYRTCHSSEVKSVQFISHISFEWNTYLSLHYPGLMQWLTFVACCKHVYICALPAGPKECNGQETVFLKNVRVLFCLTWLITWERCKVVVQNSDIMLRICRKIKTSVFCVDTSLFV
jgi:hypothetical protein